MVSGQKDRAIGILEDILKNSAEHPEAARARALLEKWKKK